MRLCLDVASFTNSRSADERKAHLEEAVELSQKLDYDITSEKEPAALKIASLYLSEARLSERKYRKITEKEELSPGDADRLLAIFSHSFEKLYAAGVIAEQFGISLTQKAPMRKRLVSRIEELEAFAAAVLLKGEYSLHQSALQYARECRQNYGL